MLFLLAFQYASFTIKTYRTDVLILTFFNDRNATHPSTLLAYPGGQVSFYKHAHSLDQSYNIFRMAALNTVHGESSCHGEEGHYSTPSDIAAEDLLGDGCEHIVNGRFRRKIVQSEIGSNALKKFGMGIF